MGTTNYKYLTSVYDRHIEIFRHTFAPAFFAALVVAVHIPVGSIVPSVGLYNVP